LLEERGAQDFRAHLFVEEFRHDLTPRKKIRLNRLRSKVVKPSNR
jgi:hypothetical protein